MKLGVMGAGLGSMGWEQALDYCQKVGLEAIELDGAIRQISWSVGPGGTETRASRNVEHNVFVPDFKKKRAREEAERRMAREDARRRASVIAFGFPEDIFDEFKF